MRLTRKDEAPPWFLAAARKKAEISQYSAYLTDVVEAIGDRRSRDLLDLVARTERDLGWSSTAEILSHASAGTYHPRRYSQSHGTQVEALKHREMIFELMSCSGLEPVGFDVNKKLMELSSQDSFAKATTEFSQAAIDSASSQVAGGDTLFFDSSCMQLPIELRTAIEEQQVQKLKHINIYRSDSKLDLTQVWYTEIGRKLLTDLGIKGYTTRITDESLLDVIRVSLRSVVPITGSSNDMPLSHSIDEPSNPIYRRLLAAIVNQDIKDLTILGSNLCSPTLSLLIREHLQAYEKSKRSLDYNALLFLLDTLIAVRSIDLIQTVADMIKHPEPRVSIPAVYTLSNFYHESAVAILLREICSSKVKELIKTCLQALEYVHMRTPVAEPMITEAIRSECCKKVVLEQMLNRKSWTSPGLEL
jgi:hypothetical protein